MNISKNYTYRFFLTIALGLASMGWIDPMADKIRDGNLLYQDGKYDEALDKYVNAQIDSPETPQLDFNIADVQYKRSKYNEAAQLFEKAMKYDDAALKAKSSFNLGNTLYRQGKMNEALECYKRTVDYADGLSSVSHELDTLKNDARYNYEFVEKKMKEQKQQQQNQQKQEQNDQQQKKEQDKKDKQSGKDKDKQEQDKQQPAPENNQEKKEDKKNENRNQDKDKQEDQPSEQQQQQQRPQKTEQMSKEEAERLLDTLNQSEKEARATVRDKQHFQHKSAEKDW